MKIGKISESVLKRSVLKHIKTKREEIQFGAGIGMDCAILALPEDEWNQTAVTLSVDPITVYSKDMAARAVHLAVNNVAAAGALPIGVMLTILMPGTCSEEELRTFVIQAEQACASLQIQIMGGHTEITRAVNHPVIMATGVGRMNKNTAVYERKVLPGEDIVVSKWIGLDGAAILAGEREDELLTRYPKPIIDAAKDFAHLASIVPEAATAVKSGVKVMHDINESGIFGALWEMAEGVGVGLEIDLKKIPIKQETVEICEFFDVNPYKLASMGSLLMITENGHDLVRALEQEGIAATVIGKTTDSNDRVILNVDERRFLEMPATDTLRKALS